MTRKAERWIFAAVFTLVNLLWFMAYSRVDAKLHKSKLEKAAYVRFDSLCWDNEAEVERYKKMTSNANDAVLDCVKELSRVKQDNSRESRGDGQSK